MLTVLNHVQNKPHGQEVNMEDLNFLFGLEPLYYPELQEKLLVGLE